MAQLDTDLIYAAASLWDEDGVDFYAAKGAMEGAFKPTGEYLRGQVDLILRITEADSGLTMDEDPDSVKDQIVTAIGHCLVYKQASQKFRAALGGGEPDRPTAYVYGYRGAPLSHDEEAALDHIRNIRHNAMVCPLCKGAAS